MTYTILLKEHPLECRARARNHRTGDGYMMPLPNRLDHRNHYPSRSRDGDARLAIYHVRAGIGNRAGLEIDRFNPILLCWNLTNSQLALPKRMRLCIEKHHPYVG
jgi:hypothetical protein